MRKRIGITIAVIILIMLGLSKQFMYKKVEGNRVIEKNGVYTLKGKELNGKLKFVDDHGDIKKVGIFRKGKLVGEHKDFYWYNDLNTYYPYIEEEYDKKGRLQGKRLEYYYKLVDDEKKGVLYKEEFYVDGLKEGYNKQFHRNGKLHLDENYVAGKLEGVRKLYYYTGKLKLDAQYKNGKPVGKYTWYFENGNIKKEYLYTNEGNLNGLIKEYYEDGSLHREINYKDGIKVGVSKSYYQDGSKLFEALYEKGKIVEGTTWNYDGTIRILIDDKKVEEYAKEGYLYKYTDKVERMIYEYDSKGRVLKVLGMPLKVVSMEVWETIYERNEDFPEVVKKYSLSSDGEKKLLSEAKYNEFGLFEYEDYQYGSNRRIDEYLYDTDYNLVAFNMYEYTDYADKMELSDRYEKSDDVAYMYILEEYKVDNEGKRVYKKTSYVGRGYRVYEYEYIYEGENLIETKYLTTGKKTEHFYNGRNEVKTIRYKGETIVREAYREYDQLGRKVKELDYNHEDNRQEKIVYEYYKNTNMYSQVTKTKYKNEMKVREIVINKNEYDEQGRLVKKLVVEDLGDDRYSKNNYKFYY